MPWLKRYQAWEWARPPSSAPPAGCGGSGTPEQSALCSAPSYPLEALLRQPGNQRHSLQSAEADWKWFELIYLILLIRELGAPLEKLFLIRCAMRSGVVGSGDVLAPPPAFATWPHGQARCWLCQRFVPSWGILTCAFLGKRGVFNFSSYS